MDRIDGTSEGSGVGGTPGVPLGVARREPIGRREEKRRRTVEALLDAAARVFARKGFGGTSVDEVAEEAGLTKGAVYWNFAGKEELFLALFDRRMADNERASEQLAERFAAGDLGPDLFVEKMVERHRRFVEDEDGWALLNVEFWLYAMRNPKAREEYAARWRAARGAVALFLEAVLRRRGARAPRREAGRLAALLVGVDMGLGMQEAIDPEEVKAEAFGEGLRLLLGDTEGG